MDHGLDALDRPVGRLLRLAQRADPQDVVSTLSMTVAELGGDDVALYLVDYQQSTLQLVQDDAGRQPKVVAGHGAGEGLAVEGTLAGRAWTSGRVQAVPRGSGWLLWVPVVERAQRLGVLRMTMPVWDERVEHLCEELGIAAAHLVLTAGAYTDLWSTARRTQPLTLAAEAQWSGLPPLSLAVDGTTVSGLLEPAYEVAGDSFDYSHNAGVLDVVVFDAMGHGLRSSVLGTLALAAYRHSRRSHAAHDLRRTLLDVDAVIAEYAGGDSFVTAVAARLDTATGRLTWMSAGHPPPVVVRHGHTMVLADYRPAPPLGLMDLSPPRPEDVCRLDLEPGDGVLLYSDGVVESRDEQGQDFGEDRLCDFLERAAASHLEPAETLRRLIRSVMEHNAAELRDDATTVYLCWSAAAPRR